MVASLFPVLGLMAALSMPQKSPLLSNGGFERGLEGWKPEGAVEVGGPGLAGKASLKIGPGKGAVRRRYDVPGLRILLFGATLRGEGALRLQCFDKDANLLMEETAGADPKKDAGIYLKTQARTAYVILSIEKGAKGELVADGATLQDDDRDRVAHAPTVDLDTMMRPLWQGRRVDDETVLLLNGTGRLLFRPTRVVSVRSDARTFKEGEDYTVEDNVLSATKGSLIPTMADAELPQGEFPWKDLSGRHVFVTYEHDDAWAGPAPTYEGERLSRTVARLTARKPLTIVALGDSITLGNNVSGFRNVSPYLPTWADLFARQLGVRYGDKDVKMVNVGLGGMTADWGVRNADRAVAALDPDLVVVAFGMNDFWSYTPPQFAENIRKILLIIRARRPKAEFVLVAPIKFDPAYTADPTYVENLNGYARELRRLVEPGVALLNMTSLSGAIYGIKGQKSVATDPMHPNDFLARWYAQALFAMLDKP